VLSRYLFGKSQLLIGGTLAALLWANLAPHSYELFEHTLHFWVNDIGMVFFFAIAAKEVFEATLPGGPLSSPKTAGLPLLAAAGGMVGPAGLFVLLSSQWGHPELLHGWAIPCATDIAFSALIVRLIFGRNHPAVPFLLMLAIADDALGLIILAAFYPSGPLRLGECAILMAAALAVAWMLRRQKVASFWPYVLAAGTLSWLALSRGGLHPALALVPIVPFMPHAPRDLGILDEQEALQPDTLNRFEHWWHRPVEVVLGTFGLVNAGVPLGGVGHGTWVVLVAILVGKPLGIAGATWLGRVLSLEIDRGISARDVIVAGLVAGIGFTVALFFATAAFPSGELLEEVKMGALLSFLAAPLSVGLAKALGVGRWAPALSPSRGARTDSN
jgi:NhaA family Na+:H+ antiporter